MKLGIIYPQTELQGDPQAVKAIGQAVEELGFDFLVGYDHVVGATHDREPKLWGPYTDKHPFHDPLMMFSYLAGNTQRLEFVTGILILPQRQTALVARQAADLDLLSNQRFRMGVGIGWNYVEYDALGQNFKTRGKRVEEQIELLRRLWNEPLVDFTGEFDCLERVALNPRPKQNIPIWLGGFADVALQRAAKIADGFIFADGAADAFEQCEKLQEYLEQNGRTGESFGMQCNMLKAQTPEAVLDTATRWQSAGGNHAAVNTMGLGFSTVDQHITYIEKIAEAAKTLAN